MTRVAMSCCFFMGNRKLTEDYADTTDEDISKHIRLFPICIIRVIRGERFVGVQENSRSTDADDFGIFSRR
jgi:hypothetical protein